MMSEIVYQYQQAYVPNNGNTFHFWVDCTKEIHDEEAREGGTVRTLYIDPPAAVLRVQDGWIKCSERMPEDESWVLVTNGKHVGVGAYLRDEHLEDDERWQDEHFEFINLQSKYPVTHWMPLPPPETSNEQ